METSEIGYMEISDLDDRFHRAPAGWELADVKVNPLRSSQIFRYVRVEVEVRALSPFDRASGLMAMVGACGVAILGLPFVEAILSTPGVVL